MAKHARFLSDRCIRKYQVSIQRTVLDFLLFAELREGIRKLILALPVLFW